MNKIIFLDVDGVLNNRNSMNLANGEDGKPTGNHPPGPLGFMFTVDKTCVQLLRNLVENHDLKIVVSSTWRFHPHALSTALEWCGWSNPPIIGKTDREGNHRGMQIQRWLDQHKDQVSEWAIIDDDSQDIHQKDHFVHTKHEVGLTSEHILQLRNILKLVD